MADCNDRLAFQDDYSYEDFSEEENSNDDVDYVAESECDSESEQDACFSSDDASNFDNILLLY